jgi:hypothetical protein
LKPDLQIEGLLDRASVLRAVLAERASVGAATDQQIDQVHVFGANLLSGVEANVRISREFLHQPQQRAELSGGDGARELIVLGKGDAEQCELALRIDATRAQLAQEQTAVNGADRGAGLRADGSPEAVPARALVIRCSFLRMNAHQQLQMSFPDVLTLRSQIVMARAARETGRVLDLRQ